VQGKRFSFHEVLCRKHDIVIIGAGPGGYVAAIRAAATGPECRVCRRGSGPGRYLLAHRVHSEQSNAGIERTIPGGQGGVCQTRPSAPLNEITLDLAAMLQRKVQVVSVLTRGVESLFKKNKITRYLGRGQIDGPGRVIVSGSPEKD